jgi:hypothetical protein
VIVTTTKTTTKTTTTTTTTTTTVADHDLRLDGATSDVRSSSNAGAAPA